MALIIGRDPGEYIAMKIDDKEIFVKVFERERESSSRGGKELRLSIEAPREVEIIRGEIYETEGFGE